jgi:predicted nucleic acid-binding protein
MTLPGPDEVLLDTDVLSFLFNQDPVRVPRYAAHLDGRILYASFISVAEMRFGARLRGWGPARCARLDRFVGRYNVVESTPRIGAVWAQIRADAQRSGHMIERQDAWIAAVAVALDLPLVTHNASHFAHVPLLQIITEPDR